MPEYNMDLSNARDDWESLDDFTKGWIEAAFFTNQCPNWTHNSDFTIANWWNGDVQEALAEGRLDGVIPSDCGVGHIHPDSIANVKAYCERWQAEHAGILEEAYARPGYSEVQAGRDFFFTSNRHGVGFEDRTEIEADGLRERLASAAGWNEASIWFGDHVDYGDAPWVHIQP